MKPDHVTLLVSSLERSMPYYERLLPLLGFHKQGHQVWTDGAGFHCQFLQANADARPYERYGAGMNHLGFRARFVARHGAVVECAPIDAILDWVRLAPAARAPALGEALLDVPRVPSATAAV